MSGTSEVRTLFKAGILAAFVTLAFIGTAVIRIPIPATGGYFNLGDTFVMVSALLYGPLIGLGVGLIGPALADAVGFPQFILATALVKGFEGLIVGLVAVGSNRKKGSGAIPALMLGILILVGGYYLFEAMVYPLLARSVPFFGVTDAKAALAEILPNLLQGVLSAVIAFGIFKVLTGRSKE